MQKARSQPCAPRRTHQPPTACKHVVSGTLSLPAQGCFSPVPHGTCPLSVTRESLALEGGPPGFTPDSTSRALLRNPTASVSTSPTGLSPSMVPLSRGLRFVVAETCVGPTTPPVQGPSVWAGPVSLAATSGISFDFSSSGYLDVSVPQVRLPFGMTALARRRVSPFGHLGINACVPLPRAYRSLPRPSSPPCAQASPTCFHSLDSYSVKPRTRDLHE